MIRPLAYGETERGGEVWFSPINSSGRKADGGKKEQFLMKKGFTLMKAKREGRDIFLPKFKGKRGEE